MQDCNKIFIQLTANYHLEKTCENFLTTKYGIYDEVDDYLVNCLANGEFYFIFYYRERMLFFDACTPHKNEVRA